MIKEFIDTKKVIIDKAELRELLKSYFDAGYRMAFEIIMKGYLVPNNEKKVQECDAREVQ